jgi:uncharacterized protein YabE (DUF348 family)
MEKIYAGREKGDDADAYDDDDVVDDDVDDDDDADDDDDDGEKDVSFRISKPSNDEKEKSIIKNLRTKQKKEMVLLKLTRKKSKFLDRD